MEMKIIWPSLAADGYFVISSHQCQARPVDGAIIVKCAQSIENIVDAYGGMARHRVAAHFARSSK